MDASSPPLWPWIAAALAGGIFLLFLGLALLRHLVLPPVRPALGLLVSVWRSVRTAVAGDPEVLRLKARHPRLFSFMGRRLDQRSFSGLPATLLGVAFLYILIHLLGVVEAVLLSDPIVATDLRVANLLSTWRSPALTRFFLWVTALGTWPVGALAVLGATAWLFLRRRRGLALGLWVSVTGGALVTLLGKVALHRPRPEAAAYAEWSYSFPSGHAVVSVALYGFLAYLAFRSGGGWRRRAAALAAALAVISGVGLSRLYLGVHFLSDVWGGILLGLLWLIVGVSLAEVAARRPATPAPGLRGRGGHRFPALLLFLPALAAWGIEGATRPLPLRDLPPLPPQVASEELAGSLEKAGLPLFTESITGARQEPISLMVSTASEEAFIEAMAKAGWTLAAKGNLRALALAGRAALLDRPDPSAPMTPSFWDGRPHDLGFERPAGRRSTVRERHHARFWRTPLKTPGGRVVFVGTASLDLGIKWGITHRIQADLDAEREQVLADLLGAGVVDGYSRHPLVDPAMGKNFTGDPFFTDGQAWEVRLR